MLKVSIFLFSLINEFNVFTSQSFLMIFWYAIFFPMNFCVYCEFFIGIFEFAFIFVREPFLKICFRHAYKVLCFKLDIDQI